MFSLLLSVFFAFLGVWKHLVDPATPQPAFTFWGADQWPIFSNLVPSQKQKKKLPTKPKPNLSIISWEPFIVLCIWISGLVAISGLL